ncbi:18706_t:CDS:2, partial [Racocetra fulgida]
TTIEAKYHQLEKQQNTLLNKDDRLSEDQLLDYISDNYNSFASDVNNNISYQVTNCNTVLNYNNTLSTMKSHLYNKHQITKVSLNNKTANELKEDLPLKDQLTLYQTLETIKPYFKIQIQKLNLLRFIINSIYPLSMLKIKILLNILII